MKDFRDVIWYLPPTHSLRFGELWYRINNGRVEMRALGDDLWTNSASFRYDTEKFLALQLPIVVELQRLRSFNPKLFQTAMLLLMSTLIAAGDKMCPTTGADLAAKLERMVGLESELHRLLDAEKAEQKAAIDRLLGGLLGESGEDDEAIPPSKIN